MSSGTQMMAVIGRYKILHGIRFLALRPDVDQVDIIEFVGDFSNDAIISFDPLGYAGRARFEIRTGRDDVNGIHVAEIVRHTFKKLPIGTSKGVRFCEEESRSVTEQRDAVRVKEFNSQCAEGAWKPSYGVSDPQRYRAW